MFHLTDVLSTRLDSVGFNMLVANSSTWELSLLKLAMPDIILLDFLMKTDDGKDILTIIKTNPDTQIFQ